MGCAIAGVGAPHQYPLEVALCFGIYADVRPVPMTRDNEGYLG